MILKSHSVASLKYL